MPLPAWTKRDNFSAPAHQRLVDAVNEIAFQTATGEQDMIATPGGHVMRDRRPVIIDEIIFGKTVTAGPNSEADFGNNQYWVKKQEPVTPATPTNATTLQDDPSPLSDMLADASGLPVVSSVVMATYPVSTDTHSLPAGSIVLLIGYYPLSTANGSRDKRYMLVPLSPGGGVDVYNNTSLVLAAAKRISVSATANSTNVLQYQNLTVSGSNVAGLSFKTTSVPDYSVLSVVGGNVVFDYPRVN